jgi:UDP-N-acetylglucosamine 2-epimerase (non-hydrolysing)
LTPPPFRVTVAFGTRPEAVKMAPVALALAAAGGLAVRVVVTGQHREMLAGVLPVFGVTPDANLAVLRPGQSLAGLTAATIAAFDADLAGHPADLVLVQGDTAAALAGGLAAFYRRTPVGHVEAGLRTGNMQSPWPEEANRVLLTRLADLHFAPTDPARDNLLWDGVPPDRVHLVGNTVVDALRLALTRLDRTPVAVPGLPAGFVARPGPLVLVTGHRRENFGAGFEAICHAVADLARRFPAARIVYPVHLNPNVRGPVDAILRVADLPNVTLLEPLGYLEFLTLFRAAAVVLSDSGGVQEEAPALGKRVVLMRDTTERPEAVAAGYVTLAGANRGRIVAAAAEALAAPPLAPADPNPYGDGHAAEAIAAVCRDWLASRR